MLCNKICHEVGIAEIREREIMAVQISCRVFATPYGFGGTGLCLAKAGRLSIKKSIRASVGSWR
jgi:hypothetical protein